MTKWKVQRTHTTYHVEESPPQTIPLRPNRAKSIARWLISKIIINCYWHLKLPDLFENWTQCTPLGLPPIAGRPPNSERPVIVGFIVARRRSTGVRTIAAGTSAENFFIWGENRPVAEQSPSGDRQVSLKHCSRSTKLAGEPPISKSCNRPKISRSPVESSCIGIWP